MIKWKQPGPDKELGQDFYMSRNCHAAPPLGSHCRTARRTSPGKQKSSGLARFNSAVARQIGSSSSACFPTLVLHEIEVSEGDSLRCHTQSEPMFGLFDNKELLRARWQGGGTTQARQGSKIRIEKPKRGKDACILLWLASRLLLQWFSHPRREGRRPSNCEH